MVSELPTSQSLSQRLPAALAVTVVATLLFGAVVVTAQATDGTFANLPDKFGVAAARQGDAWRYNLTLSGGWTFGYDDEVGLGQPVPFGTLQWAGNASVRGPDGRMHDVNRLQAEHLGYRPLFLEASQSSQPVVRIGTDSSSQDTTLVSSAAPYWINASSSGWVLAGAQTILSRGEHQASMGNVTDPGLGTPLGSDLLASRDIYFNETGRIAFPDAEIPCLAFNGLQGRSLSLDSAHPILPACTLGLDLLAIPEGLVLRAKDVEMRNGVQAVRFEGQLNGTYQAWFTPAIPYPVRLEVRLPSQRPAALQEGDRDLPGDRSFALDMTGFAPGNGPLDGLDDPTDTSQLPALAFDTPAYVGATRVGPSEFGIRHPFSLTAAFREATTAVGELDAYLSGHPLSYVSGAEYAEGLGVMDGYQSATSSYDRLWRIGLTDGNQTFGFTIAQQSYEHLMPTALRQRAGEPTIAFDTYEVPSGDWRTAPVASRLPATMPTVLSLADRWAAFDASGVAANAWGFTIACEDEAGACKLVTTYWAGHDRHLDGGTSPAGVPLSQLAALPGNPYGTEERIQIHRAVSFDDEGRASLVVISDERHYKASLNSTFTPPALPPIGQPRDPGYTLQSSAISGIPPPYASWLPAADQAASVTFLGLLVGFAYWVWPKLGFVGLFSRLHRSVLLDHPARARLVQIVEAQPGIHFHDLAQKAELANGTAVHHLRKLSDSGHINVRRSGRYTCYFPSGRVDPTQAAAAPLLKSDGAKQVLDAVRSRPGLSNLELAQAIGLQPSTVNYHVQRLANAGLVATLRDGRSIRLHPGARIGTLGNADPAGAAA